MNQLKGAVKTLKSERAMFTDGKEAQRKPWQQMTFDEKGNYLEYTIYSNDNPSTYNFTNKYDSNGNISETTRSGSGEKTVFIYGPTRVEKLTQTDDTHILDKWVYTFDENGNKTKEEHILVDKVLGERFLKPIDVIVSRYNSNSQLIEEEYFNHDGSKATNPIVPIHKRTLIYDDHSRLTESTAYKSDGTLFNKLITKYDDKGNVSETIIYNAAGVVTGQNTYSDYDSDGNWRHEIVSALSQAGAKALTPVQSVYKTLAYY